MSEDTIYVHAITPEQAEQLTGQEFAPDSHFGPTIDGTGEWFISQEETSQIAQYDPYIQWNWTKELPLREYVMPDWGDL